MAKMETRQKAAGEKNLKEGEAFLTANAKKEGVKTTASGLQYRVSKSGAGKSPKATDSVKVHYHGTLIDGTVFDSSIERGMPITFAVNGVIAGWTEALQLMKEGDKWTLYIPSKLAYGERGPGGKIGPNSTLIFEVELLSVEASN
jgi:FKBP-type peptidyl-prolyl cis-trans isomerase FklB